MTNSDSDEESCDLDFCGMDACYLRRPSLSSIHAASKRRYAGFWDQIRCTISSFSRVYEAEELVGPLEHLEVRSFSDLIATIPLLPEEQCIAAIRILDEFSIKEAGPLLFECFLSDDRNISWNAQVALQGLQSRRAYKKLLHYVYSDADVARREQACYILSWSHDDSLLEPLETIFSSTELAPAIRAQAAEGLGKIMEHADRRTRRYKHCTATLLPGLRDVSTEVRFWTCYALGTMCATQALGELQRLLDEDTSLCRGWWYVKDEAADAISSITSGFWPDSDRVQMRDDSETPSTTT